MKLCQIKMELDRKEKDQKQEEKKEIVSRAAESAQHVNRVTVQKKEIVSKIILQKTANKKEAILCQEEMEQDLMEAAQ